MLTPLGQGGMGAVYEVMDRERGMRVALKSVGRVGGDALLRFKREFRAVQELHHPNFVELGELFEKDGEWFFTMELLSGTDFFAYSRPVTIVGQNRSEQPTATGDALDRLNESEHTPALALTEVDPTIDDPPLRLTTDLQSELAVRAGVSLELGFDEARLRRALPQLADALFALHRHGIIHRDIKPGNVLVTSEGRVVLIDFGLVSGLTDDIGSEHQVVGTMAYMSPEQGAGSAISPAADWYSVGVLLYEVLTGVKPFVGKGLELMMRKQTELPPAPREIFPSMPRDLDALCMDLLQIEPTARPNDRAILRRLHIEVGRAQAGTGVEHADDDAIDERAESEFVGRDAELEIVMRQLERMRGGESAQITLVGRSGLGKSALLRRFAERVAVEHPDALVLRGRCYEQESVPFKALDAVMDQLSLWLKRLPESRIASLLPDDVALLERAFPVLQRVPAISRARRDLAEVRDPQQQRWRLLQSVRALFDALAHDVPLVVLIDDFQWADEDSRHLLTELVAPPLPPPFLLFYAMRPDPVTAPPTNVSVVVQLEPLSSEQSIELATRLSRHTNALAPAQLAALAKQAEGYPFFVEALLYQPLLTTESVKLDLNSVITSAVAAAGATAQRLVEVISAAGTPITQAVAAAAAGLTTAELGHQLRTLRRLKFVRTTGLRDADDVEPYHDRIRQAVLLGVADPARRNIHANLARALEAQPAVNEPEQIAYHYRAANDPQRATTYLVMAAERAMRSVAFVAAAGFYADAESLGALHGEALRDVQIARAHALGSAGRGQQAAAAYRTALDGAAPALAIDLKRRIAEQLLASGWHEEGLAACREFLDDLDIDFPKTPRRALLKIAALEIRMRLRGLEHRQGGKPPTALELARIDACWSMAKGLAGHDPMRAQLFQMRTLLGSLDAGEPSRIARSLAMQALSVAFVDPAARPRADAILDRARAFAEKDGEPFARALTLMVGGMIDYVAHCRWNKLDIAEAERILRTKCEGVVWQLDFCSISQKQCLYWRGEWRTLRDSVRDQLKEADDRGDRYLAVQIRSHWLSFFAALDGDFLRARVEADSALGPAESKPSPVEALLNLLSHARIDLCEGVGGAALARIEAYEPGLLGSLMLKATIYRTMYDGARLAATLAAARHATGDAAKKLYAKADKLARAYPREGVECTTPMAAIARAAVAAAKHDRADALALLQAAEVDFAAQGMLAHAAVAARRRGQLLGDADTNDTTRKLIDNAERWLRAQGVADVVSVSRLHAPGFPMEV